MHFLKNLKRSFRKQIFVPAWYSILVNSNFFLSIQISKGIRRNAHYMKGSLLDFGCGTKPYRSLLSVSEYIGIDIVNPAHANDTTQVDVFYDGATLPYGDGTFDSVFSTEVITHVFNPERTLAELNRVMKPGGSFLLTVPFVWKENEKPNDYGRYTSFGIRDLLQKAGFEIVVQEKAGNYFLVICQLVNDYLYCQIPDFKLLRYPFTFLVLFPLQVVEGLLSLVAPKNDDLFFTNILVATKRS
jgi:SAM-dependent methyltransferase